jgi:hypothetical protein
MAEYRRRLPHFHPDGEYQFVTWRLHGSLPVAPPDIVYATPGHAFAAEDRALAQGHGRLWLSDTRVAQQVWKRFVQARAGSFMSCRLG